MNFSCGSSKALWQQILPAWVNREWTELQNLWLCAFNKLFLKLLTALSTSNGRIQHMFLPPLCHLSNIKGFHGEDVNATRLKVVPQVVGRDHQQHLTGVALLSVELDKHVGVWAAPGDVTCLHRDVIANVWHRHRRHKHKRQHEFQFSW